MSALDPLIGCQATEIDLPFKRLAALAAGLPLPAGPAPDKSNGMVQLTIAKLPPGKGGQVTLEIVRTSGSRTKVTAPREKPAKEVAPKPVTAAAPPKPSTGGIAAGKVPFDEPPKLDAAAIAACQVAQEVDPSQARVMAAAEKAGLSSAQFWRVRSDYYDQELPWRRDVLGASSVVQLCKAMIMENTKVGEMTLEQATSAGRVKYVCVVLQYAGAKLNKEKLHDAVRRMDGKNALGKKQYSLRMVSQETSDSLSGFEHNAVTPLGMVTSVPVLLSDKIKTLPEGKVWLGGGHVDVKMRVDVKELVEKFAPAGRPVEFADVTG